MDETKELLETEIQDSIQRLSDFHDGSEEKSRAISELKTLYGMKLDELRLEAEIEDKRERVIEEQTVNVRDAKHKEKQLKEQKLERYFKTGIAAAELIFPLIFYAAWMRKGFKFEETGTFTSQTFRGLFGKFKPTKK